ncbi:MAG: 6,7-dimethyl-8-ribityllumazine synthase [Steroidobacter sp.]
MDSYQHSAEGVLAHDFRFVIVAARFNDFVVEPLIRGAVETLKSRGASDQQIAIVRVPGAFELPIAAMKCAQSGNYDAVIALGAVIKGGTPHFHYVSAECASGLSRVALDTGIPVAFGVLTTDTVEQAVERAAIKPGNDMKSNMESNKGADAALVALEMVNLFHDELFNAGPVNDKASKGRQR